MKEFTIIDFVDGDIEKALLDGEGRSVISGDYYHDKINEKIDGFFVGLDYAGVKYRVIEIEREGSLYNSEYA